MPPPLPEDVVGSVVRGHSIRLGSLSDQTFAQPSHPETGRPTGGLAGSTARLTWESLGFWLQVNTLQAFHEMIAHDGTEPEVFEVRMFHHLIKGDGRARLR